LFSFHPIADHIEGLSVSWIETYGIDLAVQKYIFEQFGLFRWFARKVQGMSILCEF